MYSEAKTWSPFKGCEFDCVYCTPSFQKQAKRQKHLCADCYTYTPHCHDDRLDKIPSARIIFVCGNADISFCPPDFTRRMIERIVEHNARAPHKTYYFQSKRPTYFQEFLADFPENVILLTTLETNRDADYAEVSRAPVPSERYQQFRELGYPRKVVTIEPVMDFDVDVFPQWIVSLLPQLEYVWLGYNSRPKNVRLPEPSAEKIQELVEILTNAEIPIRAKDLRGIATGIPACDS